MKVNNPRYPHTCRIIRYAATEPLVDQANVSYNPMEDESETTESSEESESAGYSVIYEGVCRSDNRTTTSDNGDVNASYRTLALPLKQDEWTEETIPLEGDTVILQRIGYIEQGVVIDKWPGNLGTHILWKYVRN